MWGEFAVEPAAMTASLDRFVGMIDRFGIDKGRVICDFAPRGTWPAAVIASAEANGFGPVALASVVERLKGLNDARGIDRMGRTYPNVPGGWLANARVEDARRPFHAVVTEAGGSGCAGDCRATDARSDRGPFRMDGFASVPRTAAGIAGVAAPLLRFARTIHLVDPHVSFTGGGVKTGQWVRPLVGLIAHCDRRATVTIHLRHGSDKPSTDEFRNAVDRYLAPQLPAGISVRVRRWGLRLDGELFHDRAVLTDAGGLTYGHGLSEGPAGSTVNVQRLDASGWATLLSKFDPATTSYELSDDLSPICATSRPARRWSGPLRADR